MCQLSKLSIAQKDGFKLHFVSASMTSVQPLSMFALCLGSCTGLSVDSHVTGEAKLIHHPCQGLEGLPGKQVSQSKASADNNTEQTQPGRKGGGVWG